MTTSWDAASTRALRDKAQQVGWATAAKQGPEAAARFMALFSQ